jgi:hypothetical protein
VFGVPAIVAIAAPVVEPNATTGTMGPPDPVVSIDLTVTQPAAQGVISVALSAASALDANNTKAVVPRRMRRADI